MREGTQAAVRSEGGKCLSKNKNRYRKENTAGANNNPSLRYCRGMENEDVTESAESDGDKQALRGNDRKRKAKMKSGTAESLKRKRALNRWREAAVKGVRIC